MSEGLQDWDFWAHEKQEIIHRSGTITHRNWDCNSEPFLF